MSLEKLDHVVSGALLDFAAWLTTREKQIVISSKDESGEVARLVNEFLKMRGVDTKCMPMVQDWQYRCGNHVVEVDKSEVQKAFHAVFNELRNDPDLYQSYQANIAMAFYDTVRQSGIEIAELHKLSNDAATYFLNQLLKEK